ncbi:peptidase M24, structural domain-containing protein [Gautieria morchelliformis]|nr:peptidase M24, structural domain-containing protein [Gautieria morchelliformis]
MLRNRVRGAAEVFQRWRRWLSGMVVTGVGDAPQVLLLHGSHTSYRNDTDQELPFRQESNFYYLTDCDLPDAHLLLVSARGTVLQTRPLIRLPAPPTVAEAAQTYSPEHISSVNTSPELLMVLEKMLKAFPAAIIHTLPPYPSPFPEQPHEVVHRYAGCFMHAYLLHALHKAQLIKTPEEISLIRTANDISSRAHEVVMRLLGKGVRGLVHTEKGKAALSGEWLIQKEAEAEAVFVATKLAVHVYLPISRNLVPQALLIDAGAEAEYRNYASDVTRTMPVGNGGKFTREAREIYALVLEMQTVYPLSYFTFHRIDYNLETALNWGAVQLLCHRTEEDALASGVSAAFCVGHSLGLVMITAAERDRKTHQFKFYDYLRLRLPLEASMVTVEPGCYFSPHLLSPVRNSPYIDHEVLRQVQADVVITPDGCEVLTTVGKDVGWVEGVCSGNMSGPTSLQWAD